MALAENESPMEEFFELAAYKVPLRAEVDDSERIEHNRRMHR